jgi:mono/diheme cytochrome c family protein
MKRRILCSAVRRPLSLFARAGVVAGAGLAVALAGCGGEVTVPEDQQTARKGAVLFEERCSGCHSLDSANSYGSKPEGELHGGERTNGPDFNIRKEDRKDVLYAIRNGGFSGAIMPANIVVGQEAEAVADFVAQYSGKKGKEGLEQVNPSPNTGSGKQSGGQ